MTQTRANRFAVRFNQKTSDLYHNNKRRARPYFKFSKRTA
jgi:hypothetical protein